MKLFNTLVAIAAFSLPVITFAADTAGKIETGGNPENAFIVAPDGTKSALASGQSIPVGAKLETAGEGAAGFFFSNGAAAALRSGAKFSPVLFTQDSENVPPSGFAAIKREDGSSQLALSLTQGTGVFDASKLNSLSNLLTRTTILRTETNDALFSEEVDGDSVRISVISGSLVVVPLNGSGDAEPTILVAGEQGSFTGGSGVPFTSSVTKLSDAEAARLASIFSPRTQFGNLGVTDFGAKHAATVAPIDNTITQPRLGSTPVVSPNGEGQGI